MNILQHTSYRSVPEPHYYAMKRVLITGATGGIGKACCIWLLNQGARIAMVGREMTDLINIGSGFPCQAICIQCDLTKENEHLDMVNSALENLGGLDILINVAGVIYENDLENTSCREHDYLININLRAVFNISRLCATALKRSRGCIVNLSSGWGNKPQQGMISYCMSKAGIDMLTKSLALELSPVRVNAVAPGMVHTNFLNCHLQTQEVNQIKRNYRDKNPLRRIARVDEIVKAIIFLSSNKAAKLTGEILNVDGGMHATSNFYTCWADSDKMNAKFLPNGVRPLSKLNSWIDKHIQKFKNPLKNENWVKNMIGDSNWYTNLADAHYKITEHYNKIDAEDNVLGALGQLKDVNGQIFTVENPKSARYVDDTVPANKAFKHTLGSQSVDVELKRKLKGLYDDEYYND